MDAAELPGCPGVIGVIVIVVGTIGLSFGGLVPTWVASSLAFVNRLPEEAFFRLAGAEWNWNRVRVCCRFKSFCQQPAQAQSYSIST